jgi:RNA polymerase sigma-70 factor (ECF subfamily)
MGLVDVVPLADGRGEASNVTWLGRAVGRAPAGTTREGDLAEFVLAHYPRLIRLAGLVCHNVADSEDAVQAALERAWKQRATLRDAGSISAWLDRIVVREAIRLGRDRRPWLSRLFSDPVEIEVGPGPGHDDTGASAVARIVLRNAYAALPASQRVVVALHLYEGYSVAETAAIVGIPLETARSRLRLARERLRADLGEAVR